MQQTQNVCLRRRQTKLLLFAEKEADMAMHSKETTRGNTILVKTFQDTSHNEISAEYNLPDYLPDIKRIIRADAVPKVDGKYLPVDENTAVSMPKNLLRSCTVSAETSDGISTWIIENNRQALLLLELPANTGSVTLSNLKSWGGEETGIFSCDTL